MAKKKPAAKGAKKKTAAKGAKDAKKKKTAAKGAKKKTAAKGAKDAKGKTGANDAKRTKAAPTKKPVAKKRKKTAAKKEPADERTAALVAAILERRIDDVRALIAAGANVDVLDAYEQQPLLFFAIEAGPEMVSTLLDAGADPDRTSLGARWTSLMFACAGTPDPVLVELLLAHGADARTQDGDGTALTRVLDSAEDTGRKLVPAAERIVRALLRAGADPDAPREDGWTPLMLASHSGSLDAVKALLDAGAKVDATKGEGADRLDAVAIAEHKGHAAIVDLLRASGGADPSARAEAEVAEAWEGIVAWLHENAPGSLERLEPVPATDAEIAGLEATLGATLPVDFKAHLRLHGRTRGLIWFEYEVLGVEAIASTWSGLRDLLEKGTFDDGRAPRELDPDQTAVRPVWWSRGFVPFAQDGCGNQRCVDLDPGERGTRGQVIAWEIHAGPVGPMATSFLEALRAYRAKLESGRFRFDADSGTFPEG